MAKRTQLWTPDTHSGVQMTMEWDDEAGPEDRRHRVTHLNGEELSHPFHHESVLENDPHPEACQHTLHAHKVCAEHLTINAERNQKAS